MLWVLNVCNDSMTIKTLTLGLRRRNTPRNFRSKFSIQTKKFLEVKTANNNLSCLSLPQASSENCGWSQNIEINVCFDQVQTFYMFLVDTVNFFFFFASILHIIFVFWIQTKMDRIANLLYCHLILA